MLIKKKLGLNKCLVKYFNFNISNNNNCDDVYFSIVKFFENLILDYKFNRFKSNFFNDLAKD